MNLIYMQRLFENLQLSIHIKHVWGIIGTPDKSTFYSILMLFLNTGDQGHRRDSKGDNQIDIK